MLPLAGSKTRKLPDADSRTSLSHAGASICPDATYQAWCWCWCWCWLDDPRPSVRASALNREPDSPEATASAAAASCCRGDGSGTPEGCPPDGCAAALSPAALQFCGGHNSVALPLVVGGVAAAGAVSVTPVGGTCCTALARCTRKSTTSSSNSSSCESTRRLSGHSAVYPHAGKGRGGGGGGSAFVSSSPATQTHPVPVIVVLQNGHFGACPPECFATMSAHPLHKRWWHGSSRVSFVASTQILHVSNSWPTASYTASLPAGACTLLSRSL